jgi:hypothetical protein
MAIEFGACSMATQVADGIWRGAAWLSFWVRKRQKRWDFRQMHELSHRVSELRQY